MAKVCVEFGTLVRVLVLEDNRIIACKSYEFTEDVLDKVFLDIYPVQPRELLVAVRLIYTGSPEGLFVLDKITSLDGKALFGTMKMDNLISLQYFTKNLGLKQFKLVTNTAIYAHLLEGKTTTVLDEYGRGLYVVAPFAGGLVDYSVTTDIMLEEIAKIYPLKIGSQSFVNMLDTDLGSLEFAAWYENYAELAEDVKRSLVGLLAIPLVGESTPIQVNDDLLTKSLVGTEENVKKEEKPKVKPRKAEERGGGKAVGVSSAFLVVLIVLVCLSSVINYKMSEDIALLEQVNVNMAETLGAMEDRKVYMNNALSERKGDALAYSYVYSLASHVQVDGLLADVKMSTTGYEISYLLKSQADVEVIREKLGALLEIEDGSAEVLSRDGVNLYKVSFVHKLN